MNEQREEDPRGDADQRSALERTKEQCAIYRERIVELIRLAIRAGFGPEQAEDAGQTVWVKLLADRPTFTGENAAAQWRSWLDSVFGHEVANLYRELRRQPQHYADDLAEKPVAPGEIESAAREVIAQQSRLFHRWLEELFERRPLWHDLVSARHIDGVRPADLAETYGQTAHWISVQINRAVDDFRAWLAKHRHEEEASS